MDVVDFFIIFFNFGDAATGVGDNKLLSCSTSVAFCLLVTKFVCIIKSSEFKLDPDNWWV